MWRRKLLLGLLLGGQLMHSGAIAATKIEVENGAIYRHGPAKVSIPATLGGIPRVSAEDYHTQPDLDVSLQFRVADSTEVISVYVFRAVLGTPEVWFDRAQAVLAANPRLKNPRLVSVEQLAAPGASIANAMLATYALDNVPPYRSTALAIVPVDGWMVSLRFSSSVLDTAEIRSRMIEIFGEIQWPSFSAAGAAKMVVPCGTLLPLGKRAKMASRDPMNAALLGSLIGTGKLKEISGRDDSSAQWCRDATLLQNSAVYRVVGANDAYIITFGDNGSGVSVGDSLAGFVSKRKKTWSTKLIQLDQTHIFADFDRLPAPDQAIELVEKTEPISSVTTWPMGGNITITLPAK